MAPGRVKISAPRSAWGLRRRRLVLRIIITGALVLGGVGVGQHAARAATVTFTGPSSCADAGSIAEQAEDLLGRRLADVTGVDFEVALAKTGSSGWSLRLDTLEGDRSAAGVERIRRSRNPVEIPWRIGILMRRGGAR